MSVILSLIVPVYNVENYLESCLGSIFDQDISNFEVIVVNDGSTDRSIEIANKFLETHSNLQIIHKENGGLSSARNFGMPYAKGKYIWFVDSDDWIEENVFKEIIERLENYELDALLINTKNAFSNGSKIPRRKALNIDQQIIKGPQLFKTLVKNKAYLPMVWLFIYRREFLEAHRFTFIHGIIHEDEPFTLKFLSIESRIQVIDNCFYYYRLREGSIMERKITDKNIRDILFIIQHICENNLEFNTRLSNYRAFQLLKTLFRRIKNRETIDKVLLEIKKTGIIKKIHYSSLFDWKNFVFYLVFKIRPTLYWKIYSSK